MIRGFMSDEYLLSRKSYNVVEVNDGVKPRTPKELAETLTQRNSRLLRAAVGRSVVLMDPQPLDVVGTVSVTEEQMKEISDRLKPEIKKSVARLRRRRRDALASKAIDMHE